MVLAVLDVVVNDENIGQTDYIEIASPWEIARLQYCNALSLRLPFVISIISHEYNGRGDAGLPFI